MDASHAPHTSQPVQELSEQDRSLSLVAHLGGPAGLLLSAGLLGFVVPLIVWLAKRGESAFVENQAKEALNFQITLLVAHVAGWLFVFLTFGLGLIVVWPAYIALWVGELALGIWAAMQVYSGRRYRYPFNLRLIA
jgi:uncharacterized Tic20 family protein